MNRPEEWERVDSGLPALHYVSLLVHTQHAQACRFIPIKTKKPRQRRGSFLGASGLRDSRRFVTCSSLRVHQKLRFLRPHKTKKLRRRAKFFLFYGGEWTRTTEDRSRGIYSPLQLPLCDTPS